MTSVLAVDLGGTSMRVARVDAAGGLHARREEPTGADPHDLVALARTVLTDEVTSAVVGVPGRVDYGRGCLEFAPNLDDRWDVLLDERALAHELGLPVSVANDADLAAVGEACFGAGRDHRDVAYLTISTGVGAGVVTGGVLVHGRRSLAEIGHSVIDLPALAAGRPASVEELASGTALARLAADAGLDVGGRELVERVRRGDERAAEVLDRVVTAGAVGAVNLVHLFMPEVLVVGGGVGLNGDLVLEPIRRLLATRGPKQLPRPVAVVNAELGDDAALAGAAAWRRAFRPEAASREASSRGEAP